MITIQSLSDWTGLGMLWELKKDRKDHSLSAFEAKKRTKTGVFWSLWGQNLTWKFTFFENLTKIWLKSENESVFWSLEDTNGPFWMPGGSIYPSVRVQTLFGTLLSQKTDENGRFRANFDMKSDSKMVQMTWKWLETTWIQSFTVPGYLI